MFEAISAVTLKSAIVPVMICHNLNGVFEFNFKASLLYVYDRTAKIHSDRKEDAV